ncbi:MAG: hypothetical protein AABW51_01605 [Nanoarchaeota archaeon]
MGFEEQLKAVNNSYQERVKRIQEVRKQIWEGFKDEVSELEKSVSDEFKILVNQVGPIKHSSKYANFSATIEAFSVEYEPELNRMVIKVEELKTGDGKIISEEMGGCPHGYVGFGGPFDKDSRTIEFMKKYHVNHIRVPDNCEHK